MFHSLFFMRENEQLLFPADTLLCKRDEFDFTSLVEVEIFGAYASAAVATRFTLLTVGAIVVDVIPLAFEFDD